MKLRKSLRYAWAGPFALCVVMLGCRDGSAQMQQADATPTTGDGQVSGGDEEACTPMPVSVTGVDMVRGCVMVGEARMLCVASGPSAGGRGLRQVCLVSPSGEVLVALLPESRQVVGKGWRHAAHGAWPSTLSSQDVRWCTTAWELLNGDMQCVRP